MSKGQFILTADFGKLIQGFVEVNRAQDKTQSGFRKTTDAGRNMARTVEGEIKRLERATQQQAVQAVAGAKFATGSAGLSLSAAQRAQLATMSAAAAPGTDARDLQNVALQRRLLAGAIRESRATTLATNRQIARNSIVGAGNLAGLDAVIARGSALSSRIDADAATREASRQAKIDHDNELEADLAGLRYEAQQRQKVQGFERRQRIAAGALAVGAAISRIADAAGEELDRYADTILQFENTMAPLYGVGKNMANRAALRSQVLAMSTGSGISAERVAELRGRLQSAFGDLPPAVAAELQQQALMSSKLGVKDMSQFAIGLGAAYQAYGGALGGGQGAARILGNQFETAADIGAFDKDTITPYLARVLYSTKAAGYDSATGFALLAQASRSGMDPESYATGVANLNLDMMQAASKGKFKLTGDPLTDFGNLGKMNKADLLDLADKRNFVIARLFAEDPEGFGQIYQQVKGSSAAQNIVGSKLAMGYSDPLKANIDVLASAKAGQANAPNIVANMPGLADTVSDWEVRKFGADLELHPMFKWFKYPSTWLDTAKAWSKDLTGGYAGKYLPGDLLATGARQLINDATAAGDLTKAGYLQLRYGENLGTYYKDARGNKVTTTVSDANEYLKLITKGYTGLTGDEFLEYKRLGAASPNPQAASDYLDRVGGFTAPGASGGGDASVAQGLVQAGLILQQVGEQMRQRPAPGGSSDPGTALKP